MAQKLNVSQVDLTSLTPKQLKELMEKAQERYDESVEERITALKERIEKMCFDEGLTLNQVVFKDRFGKVSPKYRDPATGRTWSGRGKKPKWLEGHEAEFSLT